MNKFRRNLAEISTILIVLAMIALVTLSRDYVTIGHGLMPEIAVLISALLIGLNACQYLIAIED